MDHHGRPCARLSKCAEQQILAHAAPSGRHHKPAAHRALPRGARRIADDARSPRQHTDAHCMRARSARMSQTTHHSAEHRRTRNDSSAEPQPQYAIVFAAERPVIRHDNQKL